MMTVAMMGKAVSPVTSYLATEPGVRPSVIGLEEGLAGFGVGSGMGGMGMSGVGGVPLAPPDPMTLLARAAAACVKRHQPAAGWAVHLDMETTGHEVVDVVPGAGATTPVGACLIEAVWALPLPTSYVAARATHPLDFQ